MLKGLIYLTLGIFTGSNSLDATVIEQPDTSSKQIARPIKYLDQAPEDFFALARKFNQDQIEKYEENLGADASKIMKSYSSQIHDYSLVNDLIPQVINIVTKPSYQTSLKILSLTKDDDTIIYLGRSPAILHSLCTYLSPLNNRNPNCHIQLNYSGSPNISNTRNMDINDLRNVITEERLLHFFEYLDKKGLDKITPNKNLYIVDQVGKGGGMNSFLRILTNYYTEHKKLTSTPNIALFLMNFNDEKTHIENGFYDYNPRSTTLTFCPLNAQNKGFRALSVQAIALNMSEEDQGALDVMDDEQVQHYLLPTSAYPAFCWTKEYDQQRDSNPELAPLFVDLLVSSCAKIMMQSR